MIFVMLMIESIIIFQTCMTPPPLLPSFNARKSSGSPIALPFFLFESDEIKKSTTFFSSKIEIFILILLLPSQSSTIVSSSVQAGLAAYKNEF